MEEHPEGGYFRETYRCAESVGQPPLPERYAPGPRAFGSAIYFLLKGTQVSRLHRLKSDEIWHFYFGDSVTVHILGAGGIHSSIRLGDDPEKGEHFQAVVPFGSWMGAVVDTPSGYALVGCTVSPGFEFRDFELGRREELIARYPEHRELIEKLA